jgi:malate dehydrogenase (oxaloacetate-decarboxylating)(NADP+)
LAPTEWYPHWQAGTLHRLRRRAAASYPADPARRRHQQRIAAEDTLYLDVRQPRVRGEGYDAMIEEFVAAVQDVFPNCCIQFEDFANIHSVPILAQYRDRVCCFNDDIQGTAAVAVAGIFGALRTLKNRMVDQTFLILGAGSAGTGIADLLTKTMMQEGVPEAVARARCWLFDSKGVVVSSRTELADFKKPYAHDHAPVPDFLGAIEDSNHRRQRDRQGV